MTSHLQSLVSLALCSAVSGFEVNGYWTYSPSFEAMSGIKGIKQASSGEDNLFLIPERNSYKIGNETIYQCKMCDFRSRHPKEYEQHAKEKHFFPGHEKDHQWLKDLSKRQDYNYTCNVCGEIYKTDMALLWHITKYDHVIDDHDNELAKYLRARIQLNQTVGRKVVYHPLVRPFYKIVEPPNETHAQSDLLNDLADGYAKATFVVPADELSSGDISDQLQDDSVIKTGFSKYQKSDCEKRFKKQNGVNVYQRSPEVQYSETDEEAEEKRLTEKERRLEEKRKARRAYSEQDTDELMKKEMKEEEESEHSASYYRRQLEEYGPWASHSDKVGDRKLKKVTRIVTVTKPDVNRKDPILK